MNRLKLTGMCFFVILMGCDQSKNSSGQFNYKVVQIETAKEEAGTHVSACVISQAPTAESRKNTLIIATQNLHKEQKSDYYFITMANHESFCQHEERLTAIGMYSVNKTGWYGNNLYTKTNQKYEWNVLTTDHTNTAAQIEYTLEYLKVYAENKISFIEQYGVLNYYEPLREFVEKQISKEPEFVTSGMWVDNYFIR